jgi:hypothetical protein
VTGILAAIGAGRVLLELRARVVVSPQPALRVRASMVFERVPFWIAVQRREGLLQEIDKNRRLSQ